MAAAEASAQRVPALETVGVEQGVQDGVHTAPGPAAGLRGTGCRVAGLLALIIRSAAGRAVPVAAVSRAVPVPAGLPVPRLVRVLPLPAIALVDRIASSSRGRVDGVGAAGAVTIAVPTRRRRIPGLVGRELVRRLVRRLALARWRLLDSRRRFARVLRVLQLVGGRSGSFFRRRRGSRESGRVTGRPGSGGGPRGGFLGGLLRCRGWGFRVSLVGGGRTRVLRGIAAGQHDGGRRD